MKFIKTFFNHWIYPIIVFVVTSFLFVLAAFNSPYSPKLQNTVGVIMCVGICVLLISSIILFAKKEWKKGIISLILLIGGTVVSALLFFIIVTGLTMIDGDHWADDLKIPNGIQIENPMGHLGSGRTDSMLNIVKTETDLALYNAGQPGMYQYDFWTKSKEEGLIYLKAYEITKGEQLSPKGLEENSSIPIYNTSDSIVRFSSKSYFTIYEGDWGKYYAARFEVWFKPNSGEVEIKLFQKNFKIEGWMH